jgi:Alginate export
MTQQPDRLRSPLKITWRLPSPQPLALALLAIIAAPGLSQETKRPAEPKPFKLHTAWNLPKWLDLRVEQRTRFEHLDDTYKAGQTGHDQQLALRTSVFAAARYEAWILSAELLDSRAYLSPHDAVLDTTMVNAVELLQAHLGYTFDQPLGSSGKLELKLGRQTLDLGSRRLMARNAFRNTINAFTGLYADWNSGDQGRLQALYLLPVNRLPNDAAGLEDNAIEFDEELEDTRLLGFYGSQRLGASDWNGELYAFNLDESDEPGVNTRDRRLWTLGGRAFTPNRSGKVHYEWESAYQFGDARSSTGSSNTTDLDTEAWFHHLTVGYQFDAAWKPRVEGLLDYASGDDDPNDGEYNRFDTLYGARRFEFGPTGILGLIARANLISPGLRTFLEPNPRWRVMLAHRLVYLESDQDAWSSAGIVDPAGASGRYVGQTSEFSVSYEVLPKNLWIEVGAQHLFAGSFVEEAPNATGQGDPTYVYLQTTLRL